MSDTNNILRDSLGKGEISPGISFSQIFSLVEKRANEDFVPLLNHDMGSYNGPVHIKCVEDQIASLINQIETINFSPAESYVLLCSILFHDIGKLVDKDNHEEKSAQLIEHGEYNSWFGDSGLAHCISVVCKLHSLRIARDARQNGEIEDLFFDRFGRIRIGWLAALLSLADELDNSYHRVADLNKFRETNSDKDSKGSMRSKIRGCEVNLKGKLLIIHPLKGFEKHFESDSANDKTLYYLSKDIQNKVKLIEFWFPELRQMEIELFDTAVNIRGHLISLKRSYYIASKNKRKKHIKSYFTLITEPVIRPMKVERLLEAALQIRFSTFGKTTFPWETLASEAGIADICEVKLIFHRIRMLARLFFHQKKSKDPEIESEFRIRRLIPHNFTDLKNNRFITDFIELDGEWSINLTPYDLKNIPDENTANKSIPRFYEWLIGIVSINQYKTKEHRSNRIGVSLRNHRTNYVLKLNNPELAYLLDEFEEMNIPQGIRFPANKSKLYSDSPPRPLGINLVITGPPGVGKSTLAMELISQGEFKKIVDKDSIGYKPMGVYFSLEQPIETIEKLAIDLRIRPDSTPKFQDRTFGSPSYLSLFDTLVKSHDADDFPIILFPKLAPRSHGEVVDEETLYWFRFKQIARILEANNFYRLSNSNEQTLANLNTIVLDNLNAFSKHPLARHKLHQLFKLITWGGVLCIHIVEDNDNIESQAFRTFAEYLADIVIHLDWIKGQYKYKVIEVSKSRCQRHVLGKHPFKIRRPSEVSTDGIIQPSFEIYPSIHTQVSRVEKSEDFVSPSSNNNVRFSNNVDLCNLVHKVKVVSEISPRDFNRNSGMNRDAFIVLRGRPGGHKLAIGMSYIHGKEEDESALILNMGQPIQYNKVAGRKHWWNDSSNKKTPNKLNLTWNANEKIGIDLYGPYLKGAFQHRSLQPSGLPLIYIMNFHSGFLLSEEFLHFVKSFIEYINDGNDESGRISRVLFNSTAHLPEQYPLLHQDPLLLTALARIHKWKHIGLMINSVEAVGQDDRIEGISAMADIKISLYQRNDARLDKNILDNIKTKAKDEYGAKVISSDNITGKDYKKKYRCLFIDNNEFRLEDL